MSDTDVQPEADEFDPKKIRLTEKQANCLTFIEQIFMVEGAIPTADRISEVFGVSTSTVKKWMESKEFQFILNSQGIMRSTAPGLLSAQQLMIINMLLNLSDRRSDREKCEEAGITVQKLAVWRKDPEFNAYMQERAAKMFRDSDDVAYLNVIRNMQGGDLTAAKFYFEMTGKYQPSMRMDVNVDTILARLIEILQIRVKDPEILEAIARDMDELMAGNGGSSFQQSPFALEQGAIDAQVRAPVPNPLGVPAHTPVDLDIPELGTDG